MPFQKKYQHTCKLLELTLHEPYKSYALDAYNAISAHMIIF